MRNRYTKFLMFPLMVVLVVHTSCEKVVTLDLKSTGQQVVVQANVTNLPGPYTVQLNYSVPYYSNNTFPAVTGAQVKLSDNYGNTETLSEASPGIYKTSTFVGNPGRVYNLQIISTGNNCTGICMMPYPVSIDSFLIKPGFNNFQNNNNNAGPRIVCKFTDPAGVGNYYRVVIGSNDTASLGDRNTRLISDKLVDGSQISTTFGTKLQSGDTVSVQLQCIDKSTYNFYNTLNNAVGSTGAGQFLAALPANPINNIANGLGYFAAYAVTTKTLVIP